MLESLCEKVARCLRPINDTYTANMQMRLLTQGLGIYSVKVIL